MSERLGGLGFEPLPGDPEEVRRCARQHARVAAELDALAEEVARAGDVSSWRGAAASAFGAALAELPALLRTAGEAFGATAHRLAAWASELDLLQEEARALERRARDAAERLQVGHAGHGGGLFATSALLGAGLDAVQIAEAQEDLRRAVRAAQDLKERWRAGGRRAAAAVEAAAASAPPIPASLGELVWQHRRLLSTAVDITSVASVPVGLVPVAGPGLAAGLSVASTAGQAALAVHADGSWVDVALGATGVGLGGLSIVATRAARSSTAGVVTRSTARAAEAGDVGYGTAGGAMTVREHTGSRDQAAGAGSRPAPPRGSGPSPPARPPSPPARPPSPALRRLLIAPVTGEPARP